MNKKGFTLIELLAIIVLLGILAAATIPRISKQVQENDSRTQEANMIAIENASKLYVAKYYANKLVNGETITFYLSDLEKDGLLTIPDGCNGNNTITVTGTNYNYSNLSSSCYSSTGEKVYFSTQLKNVDALNPKIYVSPINNNRLVLYVETQELSENKGVYIIQKNYQTLSAALNKDIKIKNASCGDFKKHTKSEEFLIFVKGNNDGTVAYLCRGDEKKDFSIPQQNFKGTVFLAIETSESSFKNIVK